MSKMQMAIVAALAGLCLATMPVRGHAQTDVSAKKEQKQQQQHKKEQPKIQQHKQQKVQQHKVQHEKVKHEERKLKAEKHEEHKLKAQKEEHKLKSQKQDEHKLKAEQQKHEGKKLTTKEREHERKLKAEQHQKDRLVHQKDLQKKHADRLHEQEKARNERAKLREQHKKAGELHKLSERAQKRAKIHISDADARKGRFSKRFAKADFMRVRKAGWAPMRAWRRGLRAGFIAWIGPVFWPYAYVDLFDYTFWPEGYYDGYWSYAYDDFFDGIWWSSEPAYAEEEEPETVAAAPERPTAERRPAPETRVSSATMGEAACGETGKGVTAWPFDRIQSALHLTDDQQDLLDELRQAALDAAESLKTSCPQSHPRTPLERLQAISDRLEATHDAIKIVRPPLEKFYDSLGDDQRARFDALGPKITAEQRPGQEAGSACRDAKPGLVDLPIEKIQAAVKPTEEQMDLLDALESAATKAVDALKDACPEEMPRTPAERLAATQGRIEALIKAADAIRPALEDFYGALTAEQKASFDNLRS